MKSEAIKIKLSLEEEASQKAECLIFYKSAVCPSTLTFQPPWECAQRGNLPEPESGQEAPLETVVNGQHHKSNRSVGSAWISLDLNLRSDLNCVTLGK